MSKKKIVPGLRRLIDAAISGNLTDEELRRLDETLRTDDHALGVYLNYCQLEADLFFHGRATLAGRRVLSDIELSESSLAELRTSSGPIQKGRAIRARFLKARWLTALAAVVLLGFFGWRTIAAWGEIRAERQPQPIARYIEGQGAEWLGDTVPSIGHNFVEGDSVYLTKGHARISMASGAELMLRAPCFVTLASADRVQLEEGVVTAEVAEWGRGFTVSTDALSAVDLGTKFAVSVNSDGVAEAHVLNGKVRIQPLSTDVAERRSLLLSGGEAIRVEAGRKTSTRLAADRRFDAEMGNQLPFRPIVIQNTGVGLVAGDEDPNWRVVAGPTSTFFKGPEFAVVCKADDRYLRNDAGRSQWISVCNPVRPGVAPKSLFTFETTFDLTGYELPTVMVAAQVIADNGVRAVRINGRPVAMKSWELNERDQTFNKFQLVEIKDGFVAGVNKVQFDVWNGVDRYSPEDPNPMSLRVEWQAFGRPIGLADNTKTIRH